MGPIAEVLPEALALARKMAGDPALAVRQIKEQVPVSMNTPLVTDVELERNDFQRTFATTEETERMRAFLK